jgi:hypothetical protein
MAKKKRGWSRLLLSPIKIIWLTIKYIILGIYYIIKGILQGIRWIFKKNSQNKKTKNSNIKSPAIFRKFEELKKMQGKLSDFEKDLESSGKIGIILGGRGMGKSALGMRIVENVHAKTNKRIHAMGFNEEELPTWISSIKDIGEITNNSFVLLDESGINFSSRSSMSSVNKLLTELLLIARHKDVTIIFIAQNSSNIEVNVIRQADFLLLKKHSLLQLDFERKVIKELYEKIGNKFNKLDGKGATYVYSSNYEGIIKNGIPSFWNEDLSKSFSKSR